MMMDLADVSPYPNANAPAPWIQSLPSPRGLPSHRPHEGEHRHHLAEARMFRHMRAGRGEARPSILLVMGVADARSLQMHNTVRALVGTMNPLSLANVLIRAEVRVKARLKGTHARLWLRTVALLFPTMRGQRQDDSRGTTRGHRVDQNPEIGIVQRKVATGSTGTGTRSRAVVGIEVHHQTLSHRGSAA